MSIPRLFHVFSTLRVGGPQVRFAIMAERLDGYRHAVLAMDAAYDALERIGAGVDIERWHVDVTKGRTLHNVFHFRNLLYEKHPALLITYNWGAIEWALASRFAPVPHIHIEDGFGPEEADGQLLRRVFTRRLALGKSTVVLPSRTLFRLALDRWHLPSGRVRHIPNGIDVARFATRGDPVVLPPGVGAVLGTVAALRPEKNIARLLRAFRAVRQSTPCRLVIAGDGPLRAGLERLAAEILPPGSCVFLGHVEAPERVYAACDVFALSSDTEQMPISVMEAMAAGLPVVATDVGDVREMVAPENIPFVTPRDDRLFSEALLRSVTDAQTRESAGQANRDRAEKRFSIGSMLSSYDALFGATIEGRRMP